MQTLPGVDLERTLLQFMCLRGHGVHTSDFASEDNCMHMPHAWCAWCNTLAHIITRMSNHARAFHTCTTDTLHGCWHVHAIVAYAEMPSDALIST